MPAIFTVAATVLTLLATLYALAALLVRPHTRGPRPGDVRDLGGNGTAAPVPVSVLKPLCGLEPRLEHNLATFCRQTHPHYQLVFGVRDPNDPAIAVVQRLARRFPALDMQLVVDPRVHGSNLKVSNLINMMQAARHPWLVLADSDVAVAPDYLERVTLPLRDPGVGIVTCLYHGQAEGASGRAWGRSSSTPGSRPPCGSPAAAAAAPSPSVQRSRCGPRCCAPSAASPR